jgi:DNA-binding transcriptional LysR family regulator
METMDLDLAQLRAFVAVADVGHFGRAAAMLTMSQQAVSKRVAGLERAVGPLLERRPGGVGLTAAGRRLLPRAREILRAADDAVADLRGLPAAPLRVDVWGELQTPARLIRGALRADPELDVTLSMRRDLAGAVAALGRHEIDLAFGNAANLEPPLGTDLVAELLAVDTIVALVAAGGPHASRDEVDAAVLRRSGLWWPMRGSSGELRGFAEEYARTVGAVLVADAANLGLEQLIDAVRADPAAVVPVSREWPLPDTPDIAVRPLRPAPGYPWYAVWRAGDDNRALDRLLRRVVTAAPSPAAGDSDRWLPSRARSGPRGRPAEQLSGHEPPRPSRPGSSRAPWRSARRPSHRS